MTRYDLDLSSFTSERDVNRFQKSHNNEVYYRMISIVNFSNLQQVDTVKSI